ncbi:hypothetical protein ACFQJ5_01980 [Halomicroarcula sp. GCM10025324]|uniref:hypothetical protein n=1 Tax=Halomicroarcula sp. GCM10025324 TaxID=3252667 RepID=UPI00361288ED
MSADTEFDSDAALDIVLSASTSALVVAPPAVTAREIAAVGRRYTGPISNHVSG